MTDDGVLRVPIQINGGSSTNGVTLKERELFVHTESGILYYGKSNESPTPGVSMHSVGIKGADDKLFNFNGSTAVFGGLNAIKQDNGTYKLSGNYNVELHGVKHDRLIVTDSYGSTLPDSGVEGEIFFLIPPTN